MGIVSLINSGAMNAGASKQVSSNLKVERDFHAPTFELIVRAGRGAQPFTITEDVKRYISEVTYEDNSDQFDRLEIKLQNQIDSDGERSVLSFVDSKLFSEGHYIEVLMGYGNSLFTVGAASLVKKTPDFPSDGVPTLIIEGFDLLHQAARRRPKGGVSYKGYRDSQIASIIGARNGFEISTKDPRSYENIKKTKGVHSRAVQARGISDYEYLKKIADINGYDLFSKFDSLQKKFVLFFQPPALAKQKEVFSFVYNEGEAAYRNTLLSFSPTLDAHDQSSDFEIFLIKDKEVTGAKMEFFKRLDSDSQKQLKELQETRFGAKAFSPKPINSDGVTVAFKAFGRSFRFPPNKRFKNEFQIRQAIEEFIKRQKEHFITGRGTVIGTEVLQSRQVHNLLGIGNELSGKYYFTQVTHKMGKDSPYITEFACRRVIEDSIVQAPPAFNISESDERIQKFKQERVKSPKPPTITNFPGLAGISAEED